MIHGVDVDDLPHAWRAKEGNGAKDRLIPAIHVLPNRLSRQIDRLEKKVSAAERRPRGGCMAAGSSRAR